MGLFRLPFGLSSTKKSSILEDLLLIAAVAQIPIGYAVHGQNSTTFEIFSSIFLICGLGLVLIQFSFIRPFFALLGLIGFLIWLPPVAKAGYITLLLVLGAFLIIFRKLLGWGNT
jgi:hypothetical protein